MASSLPGAHRIQGCRWNSISADAADSSSSLRPEDDPEEEGGHDEHGSNRHGSSSISMLRRGDLLVDAHDDNDENDDNDDTFSHYSSLGRQEPSWPNAMEDIESASATSSINTRRNGTGTDNVGLEKAPDNNNNVIGESKLLAVAIAIDEEQEEQLKKSTILDTAKEYNPEEEKKNQTKTKVYHQRSFQAIVAVLVFVAMAGLMGGGLSAARKKKKKPNPFTNILATPTPTAAPTAAPTTTHQPLLRAFLEESIPPHMRSYSPLAYESALHWLAMDITMDLDDDDDDISSTHDSFLLHGQSEDDTDRHRLLLQQRFALAWLWYHTTHNGQEPWLSCNPLLTTNDNKNYNNDDDDDDGIHNNTCIFSSHANVSDDGTQVVYDPIPNTTRWLSHNTSECTWPGVYCHDDDDDNDDAAGVIWAISLRGLNLQGSFPMFLSSHYLLPKLTFLELIFNQLTGEIPADFGTLFEKLTFFSVNNNTMSGTIPESVYAMPHLEFLGLGNNRFSGEISLPTMNTADNNNASSSSPLVQLYLNGNNFTGALPDGIGQLTALQLLHLQRNPGLIGSTIPASWGNNLSQLKVLWLYKNGLAGSIPHEFGNLKSLLNLRIHDNHLTGALPNFNAPGLVALEASENLLNGTIPDTLYNATNLVTLSLHKNRLTGPLPYAIANLQSLVYLSLYDNQLTGTIPVQLANLTFLSTLWIHYNQFRGTVPMEICQLRSGIDSSDGVVAGDAVVVNKTNNDQGLKDLTADCDRPSGAGDDDFNDCFCCTSCCDRVNQDCRPVV
jgi:hypothetical protein